MSGSTERAEQVLRDKTRQLETITRAMTLFLDRGDWADASGCLLRGALDLTESVYGFVGVVVDDSFRVLAHGGMVWDDTTNRDFYERALRSYDEVGYLEFKSFDNLFGTVLTSGRPLIANEAPTHAHARGLPPGHPPLDHFLGVPFLWGDEVVGMIGVANRSGGYTQREQGQLMSLAQAAGVLYDSYRRTLKEAAFEAERRRAEVALRDSNQRLAEALEELKAAQQRIVREERLRALGLMASGIAHDFNNALQAIVGFSESLLESPESLGDRELVTDHLRMIRAAADHARDVVNRLKEFYRARDQDEVALPTDLNTVVEQAVALNRPKWRDEAMARGLLIEVRTDLRPVPVIAVESTRMREVLTNLIFNAVDAMPEGGALTLRTREDDGRVVLEVSDTGIGMSEAVRQRCFDPFFSTKPAPATGLGLAMVYGITEGYGSEIDIESEPGRGTTFRFRLPVHGDAEAERAPAAQSEGEEAGPSGASLRVLLVEDDPLVRRTIVAVLRRDGHAVEAVSNGREGFDRFVAESFDLVITDQSMPGMTGQQLAFAIKDRAPHKPVILLTGFGEILKATDEEPNGVDLVLSKPIGARALRKAVREAAQAGP